MALGIPPQNKTGFVVRTPGDGFDADFPNGDKPLIDETNDLFVASGGNDIAGRRGIGEPYATARFAQENNPSDNRLVWRQGTYTEAWDNGSGVNALHMLWQGTSATSRAEYLAYPGEVVQIDQQAASGSTVVNGFWANTKPWLKIAGFTIHNIRGNGGIVLERDCHDALIELNTIFNINGNPSGNVGAIYPTLAPGNDTQRAVIRNNTCYNIRVDGSISSNASCIHSYGINDSLIINNTLYDANQPVMFKGSTGEAEGNLVTLNLMYDHVQGIRYSVAGGSDPTHQNQRAIQNILYNISQNAIYSEVQDTIAINQGMVIKNNLFHNCGVGTYFRNWNNISNINNMYYNVAASSPLYSRDVDHFSDVTNFTSNRNAFYNRANFEYNRDPGTSYNSLGAWRTGSGQDINSIDSDPLLLDPVNRNYRLGVGSPCIGAGENGENIGAYLTNNDIIGNN